MNPYITVKRIEFAVTNACTSKCKHCSAADKLKPPRLHIDKTAAAHAVAACAEKYDIKSVMTFGGEPLLYPEVVCAIHSAARDAGIKSRSIITNGYFSKDRTVVQKVVGELRDSGVNSILLSVDVFHAEHIPPEDVYPFAEAVKNAGFGNFRLHPAWVKTSDDPNEYNRRTKEALAYFDNLGISHSSGNVIFPAGNAVKYLSEYYERKPVDLDFMCGEAIYTEPLDDAHSISLNPNGDVVICSFTIGNVYKDDILDIIERYEPRDHRYAAALLDGGVRRLIEIAKGDGIEVDASDHYSACSICRAIMSAAG